MLRAPDPAGGAHSFSPDPLAEFKRPISKERKGGKRKGGEGKEGKGKDGKGRVIEHGLTSPPTQYLSLIHI